MKKVEVSELSGPLTELMKQVGGQNGRTRFDEFNLWLKGVVPTPALVGGHKLLIDRTAPFNPTRLLSADWSIMEEDERSLNLTEIDLGAIGFVAMLRGDETYVNGEEKQRRLKTAGYIRLDAKIFQALRENKHRIPESWKKKTNGNTTFIYFDGTILRNSDGERYILCLYWGDGQWHWDWDCLDKGWSDSHPSAVLAS